MLLCWLCKALGDTSCESKNKTLGREYLCRFLEVVLTSSMAFMSFRSSVSAKHRKRKQTMPRIYTLDTLGKALDLAVFTTSQS